MKLTKSDLKSIVKECLVEILNEGLGGSAQMGNKTMPITRPMFSENSRRPSVSSSNAVDSRRPAPALKDAIKREAGGNKIMESILADTAASTLPKMMSNDSKSAVPQAPGGLVEQVVAQASPEDLFGDEAASKWAALAFMDSPTKK
jgi:hypothetical protein